MSKAHVKPVYSPAGEVIGYQPVRVFPNWSAAKRGAEELDRINPAAFVPFDPPEVPRYPPPNCDGNNTAGDVLAQAQYEAAVDGEGCGSVACAMTRGVND